MKILRTANLGSNFAGSYKKRVVSSDTDVTAKIGESDGKNSREEKTFFMSK